MQKNNLAEYNRRRTNGQRLEQATAQAIRAALRKAKEKGSHA
jgi:urease beta subunit